MSQDDILKRFEKTSWGKMIPRLLGWNVQLNFNQSVKIFWVGCDVLVRCQSLNELFDDKCILIWHYFTSTNRIQHDVVFLCKLGLFSSFLRLH